MLELGGQTFLMGGEDPDGFPEDGEGPVRELRVEPFAISAHAVTQAPWWRQVEGAAPVHSFEPNGLGLHNTSGNVWEWCTDWFDPARGPGQGRGKVIGGGSYLWHHSHCDRYRVAADAP